jgi:septum site-determining protein MinD
MLAEGKKLIIAFHSYKGGTGKTLLSVNLATTLANKGKKICLLDLDFRAPSLQAIFETCKPEYWLNDYMNGACAIDRVLTDCSSNYVANGKIFVGLANPSTEAIREMISKDRKWEMKALGRILSLKNSLLKELGFDYVIFDTSPGLQYSSINAVVSADVVFVVATPNKSDVEGTQLMINELYELFGKKTRIIANQVPLEFIRSRNLGSKLTDLESIQSPIVGVIACSCDIHNAEGGCFLASQKPNHQFTKVLQEIAAKIEH